MFSFFSSSSKNKEVPEWANFFNLKDYNYFISEVEGYFKKKKYDCSINDGVVTTKADEFDANQMGLSNLAQNCFQVNKKEWTAAINHHFDGMIENAAFEKEFDKVKNDFEKVKQYIGVRVFHRTYIDAVGPENTIFRSIADDLIELLVFDFPQAVMNIKPDVALPWNKSNDELFVLGLANIASAYPLEIVKEKLNEFYIWFVAADHVFAANILLDNDKLKQYFGKNGALIGVPHRHAVLIYPIDNLEVVTAVNTLIPVVKGMNIEGPGSISDKLYWHNGFKMIDLPYKSEEKIMKFMPPVEFVNMVNAMGK